MESGIRKILQDNRASRRGQSNAYESRALEGTIHGPSIYAWLANPRCDRGEGCVYFDPVPEQQITNRPRACTLVHYLCVAQGYTTPSLWPRLLEEMLDLARIGSGRAEMHWWRLFRSALRVT